MKASYQRGDYVRVRVNGNKRGRVIRVNSGSPWADDTLRRTVMFGPEPMRFVNSQWLDVLTDEPWGYDRYPTDLLEEIEPFQLNNEYERQYFSPQEMYREHVKPEVDLEPIRDQYVQQTYYTGSTITGRITISDNWQRWYWSTTQ